MSVLEITVQPTGVESHLSTTVLLDGRRWRLELYDSSVDDAWFIDIQNDAETASVYGVALGSGPDILHPYRYLDLPPGQLWVDDRGLNGRDPDRLAFAEQRAALLYQEVT